MNEPTADIDPNSLMARFKPNLALVLVALLCMAWISKELYAGALDIIPQVLGTAAAEDAPEGGSTLAGDIAAGDVKGALIQLLLHIIGGQLLLPIVAGLVAMGVKLLDEKPADKPTVPASTHEHTTGLLMAQADANGKALMSGLRSVQSQLADKENNDAASNHPERRRGD